MRYVAFAGLAAAVSNIGASFVITQLGYDVRKLNERIRYHNAHIPVMASVYLSSSRSAGAIWLSFIKKA